MHALLVGEQILDLRKGGLREDERRFDVQSTRFWLYPTTEHQRPELVKPAYRRWLTSGGDEPADRLRIEGWADVVGVATITDEAVLDVARVQVRVDTRLRRESAAVEAASAALGARAPRVTC